MIIETYMHRLTTDLRHIPQVHCFNWLDIAFTMTESDHLVDTVQLKWTWILTYQIIQKCTNCDQNHIDCHKGTCTYTPCEYLVFPGPWLWCNPVFWSPIFTLMLSHVLIPQFCPMSQSPIVFHPKCPVHPSPLWLVRCPPTFTLTLLGLLPHLHFDIDQSPPSLL